MGKKKTNQAQQTQRLQDVDDNFTDNNQTNRPSQKLTEEKVNRVHDIFPDWPKADIRRALEDSDYDEEKVVQSHLQGGDSWQEVNKTKVKETVSRPKSSRRTVSGNQNTGERVERGTRSERGRGGGRGGKSMGLTRSDRKTDTDVTAASVKEFIAPVKETTDDNVQQGTRSFRSYSEAAAVSNEPIVSEPVVVQTKPERKERPKRERQPPVKKQQQPVQEIVSPSSPPTSQQQHNRDVISPPQPSPKKSLSPQDRKQDAVVLPVGFNAVDVQFGSLGINDTEQAQANVVENPSAPLEQKESQTEFYGQSSWGGSEQYQNEPVTQSYEEGANAQYQQQYQQQQLYGFQQSQTQPRTDNKGSQAQRTSPNLPYGKQPSYAPTHPYTGIHGGAQNPYQYPTYPSYPHPYMMPNQFQYHNYPMPGNKYGQFYGQNKPYTGYAPTQGNATAPTEESNLDYNKQFEMTNPNYFYMQQHHPQQQQQGAQTETGKTKKDSRSPNEQGVDAQQQQQHQAFGHYPYAMHYGYMGFQPQNMGFPQQQYQPQPTTQQGAQSHGKGSSNQQQQSSLTGSTWQ